ncbi:MAG TPA: hypothetical protein VNU46_06400 [Gemmatimonadaceae bacterium]|jgi:hypothetical protein|nr:hypothetical protein [Gemmatimonadaceae bacterium]
MFVQLSGIPLPILLIQAMHALTSANPLPRSCSQRPPCMAWPIPAQWATGVDYAHSAAVDTATHDTTHVFVADTALVPLTAGLLKQAIAIEGDLTNFWKFYFKDKTHRDRDLLVYNITDHMSDTVMVILVAPDSCIDTIQVMRDRDTDFANVDPTYAAIFKQRGIPPRRWMPTKLAIIRAMWTIVSAQMKQVAIPEDTTSVAGRNIALVRAHRMEFENGRWDKDSTSFPVEHGKNNMNWNQNILFTDKEGREHKKPYHLYGCAYLANHVF